MNSLRSIRRGNESLLRSPALFPRLNIVLYTALICLMLAATGGTCFAQTKRLVLVKCDGLPYDLVDRFVKERDPRTGKSVLPWINYIFYERGARLANFYVRGMSLSAPSWSLLDTGQHLQIKGNVEFDRYTLHSYDYLNFFPFYMNTARGSRIDMPAAEVLDSLGVPLLVDAYPHNESYDFSVYAARATALGNSLQTDSKSPKNCLTNGPWDSTCEVPSDQLLRELS